MQLFHSRIRPIGTKVSCGPLLSTRSKSSSDYIFAFLDWIILF